MDIRRVAWPFLREIVDEVDETAYLCVMLGNSPTYAERVDASHPIEVVSRIGQHAPGHCTAMGKALCAYMPVEELADVLGDEPYQSFTPRTIINFPNLQDHFRKIRALGYAIDDEEGYLDVRCVAAPVWNHEGIVVAAVGISAPTSRLPLTLAHTRGECLSQIAYRMSKRLGYSRLEVPVSLFDR